MKLKHRSSKALVVSFGLHFVIGIVGLFLWPTREPSSEQGAIQAVLMQAEKQKIRRMNRPKRIQVRKQVTATQTNQPVLKILTSNAPATKRGVVSAAKPTQFSALDALDLSDGIGLTTNTVTSRAMPQMERVITTPIKPESVEAERPKSRLVKFIEKQEGAQRIIYCVDLSSSMLGLNPRKLRTILAIMADSLEFLELHDLFNIVTFSGEVKFYRTDFLTVDGSNVSDAIAYLDQAKPTKSLRYSDLDMLEVLQETSKKQTTLIVLFSDGILTSGFPDPKAIQQHTAGNTRIFTMGTEMAEDFPGAVLLRMLANRSRGEFWLVETGR